MGRTVAKLRKVKDKAVVKLATEIVSAWKRVASAAKSPVVKSKPGNAVKAAKASSKPKPAALSRSVSGLSSASGDSGQPSMASAERVASMLPKHRLAVRNFFRDTLKKYEPQGDTTVRCAAYGQQRHCLLACVPPCLPGALLLGALRHGLPGE